MTISGLSEEISDADLWQLVREGSVPAFEVIVRRYQSLVCAVAYNACGDLWFSEDIAQEAFLLAWRGQASLAEPSRLGAWLCGIARNVGHNAQRRASRAAQMAPLEAAANVVTGGQGPAETAVSREEEALLWQTLAQIPESYREPLILFYREEKSVAQVAAVLGLSPDAVKQRLSRGRGMLQERVAQLVEGALRRSRPGPPFTQAVLAGLTTLSIGTKTALAGTGAAEVTGSLAKAAGTELTRGMLGPVLGSLTGLVGAWFGFWAPVQLAPTKAEREYLWRSGKRMFLVALLFTGIILILRTLAPANQVGAGTYMVFQGVCFVTLWTYLAVEIFFINRAVKRIRTKTEGEEPNDAPMRIWLNALANRYRGRVFRSQMSFIGLPLLDVNVGDPVEADRPGKRCVARGWIAIGDDAYGVLLALGGRAFGVIAVGGRHAVGLIAVGGMSLGVFALGGVSAGIVAIGGLGLGWQAFGGCAVAWDLACGGAGVAWHTANGGMAIARDYAVGGAAWAEQINTPAAESIVLGHPMVMAIKWSIANAAWFSLTTISTVLLSFAVGVLLMYRRAR
ncbi:MAG TPA: sigma-70 family RNA polymerase sigma factor [Gemmataceae bacterium]|nr:sigma-70 family RNA polymerase sigma factor [Gemmataceae bacterium]